MRLALMRRATGRIEIASKEPPAWNGHIIESVSENTIFLVNLAKRLSRQQLLAGHIFFADLLARQAQHVLLNFGGYDHNAVKICKDQISRHDEHLAAADGHVVSHHPPAPLGIKRPDASMVNRKTEFDDLDAVADLAITHSRPLRSAWPRLTSALPTAQMSMPEITWIAAPRRP